MRKVSQMRNKARSVMNNVRFLCSNIACYFMFSGSFQHFHFGLLFRWHFRSNDPSLQTSSKGWSIEQVLCCIWSRSVHTFKFQQNTKLWSLKRKNTRSLMWVSLALYNTITAAACWLYVSPRVDTNLKKTRHDSSDSTEKWEKNKFQILLRLKNSSWIVMVNQILNRGSSHLCRAALTPHPQCTRCRCRRRGRGGR